MVNWCKVKLVDHERIQVRQTQDHENLLLARISRGREPPHPYLCDVNSSFDLFIKPGLNSGGHIAYKF